MKSNFDKTGQILPKVAKAIRLSAKAYFDHYVSKYSNEERRIAWLQAWLISKGFEPCQYEEHMLFEKTWAEFVAQEV